MPARLCESGRRGGSYPETFLVCSDGPLEIASSDNLVGKLRRRIVFLDRAVIDSGISPAVPIRPAAVQPWLRIASMPFHIPGQDLIMVEGLEVGDGADRFEVQRRPHQ